MIVRAHGGVSATPAARRPFGRPRPRTRFSHVFYIIRTASVNKMKKDRSARRPPQRRGRLSAAALVIVP